MQVPALPAPERAVRERWLGATGRRVPEIAVEGEVDLPDDVLWLEQADADAVHAAHEAGRPVAPNHRSLKPSPIRPARPPRR